MLSEEQVQIIRAKYLTLTSNALNNMLTDIILDGLIKQNEIFVDEFKPHYDKDGGAQWDK